MALKVIIIIIIIIIITITMIMIIIKVFIGRKRHVDFRRSKRGEGA
jgi:hypothetical protein